MSPMLTAVTATRGAIHLALVWNAWQWVLDDRCRWRRTGRACVCGRRACLRCDRADPHLRSALARRRLAHRMARPRPREPQAPADRHDPEQRVERPSFDDPARTVRAP